MSLKQKTAKGVAWSFIQRWGSHIISFSTFLLLARLLNPEDFGLVAMAGVYIAFMKVFLDQGFASAIIQRKTLEPEHLDTAFWVSVVSSLALAGISIASAGLIADLYQEPQLVWVIRCLSVNFLFKALNSVQTAILSRSFRFKSLAIRSMLAMVLGGVVGVAMAFSGFGVWSLVGQQFAIGLTEVIVLWSVSDWRPGFKVSGRHLQELFSYGINVMGLNGLTFLNRYSDNLLIGFFLGPVVLGYYTVAYRMLTVLTDLLTKTTAQVALPTFSRLQEDPERVRRAFYKATQFSSLIGFPAFFGITVLAPIIVPAMFGNQWTPSIPVMQILSFIGMLQSLGYFNGAVMMAMGKPAWSLKIKSVTTLITILGFISVIHLDLGIIAVATSFVVCGYLMFPVSLWAIHKLIHIKLWVYLRQYVAPLVGSLVMGIVLVGSQAVIGEWFNLQAALVLHIAIGAVAYALTIFIAAPKLFRQILELAQLAMPTKSKRRT